jgi:hypothetical protein
MNSRISNKYRLNIVILAVSLFLGSCKSEGIPTNTLPTFEYRLTPYLTTKPTRPSNTPPATQKITPVPSVTSTPFLYRVKENDTLSSIAFYHGVKLRDLIAVNPDIDPNFLTIGISITIPITESVSGNLTETTPVPLTVGSPICYTNIGGGVWCLVNITNNQPYKIENISAELTLSFEEFPTHLTTDMVAPLNVLDVGKSTVLSAYLPGSIPPIMDITLSLISAIPVETGEERYLNLLLSVDSIDLLNNQLQAEINGNLTIVDDNQSARYVWLTAIGYDKNGVPIGFRKWVYEKPITSDDTLFFEFILSSLGPKIETVELLYEAQS